MKTREQLEKEINDIEETINHSESCRNAYNKRATKLNAEIDDLTTKLASLKSELSQLKPERWKPEIREIYHFGTIETGEFSDWTTWENVIIDNRLYNLGFVRRTEAEAIEDGKRMYYTELYRSMGDVTDEMWEDEHKDKYYATWGHASKEVQICGCCLNKAFNVYFTSDSVCRDAIAQIGEDNFIKYVLGVKREAKQDNAKQDNAVREVKRHAKVGEHVKISDNCNDNRFIKNQIYKVEHNANHSAVYVKHKEGRCIEHPGHALVYDSEYVVLENYTPPIENFIYELSYDNGTASFKILKQPEAWRGKGGLFTAKNGVDFASNLFPAIGFDFKRMLLRGTFRDRDCRIDNLDCSQSDYNRIESALIEFKAWADKQSFESEGKK